jgi:hypothetical protein
VLSGRILPMFRTNALPPHSRSKNKLSNQTKKNAVSRVLRLVAQLTLKETVHLSETSVKF